jgi:Transposase, Mutator family
MEPSAEERLAPELMARARERGVLLTGPRGPRKQLTKTVIETALNQELTEHPGHDRREPAGNEAGNMRNGIRPKTVLTESSGGVGVSVPRAWPINSPIEVRVLQAAAQRPDHPFASDCVPCLLPGLRAPIEPYLRPQLRFADSDGRSVGWASTAEGGGYATAVHVLE